MIKKLNGIFSIPGSVVFLCWLIVFTACQKKQNDSLPLGQQTGYNRIISLSPSTTEILFQLGLEDKIIGVTSYCNYPEAAKQKPRLGGYLDPNYEAIAALQPDLVIILPEQEAVKNFLVELKLNYLIVNNKTIADILSAIETIGQKCGTKLQAERIVGNIQRKMVSIRRNTKNLARPGVLISIGRTLGSGTLADVYAAGGETYYSELVEFAGGKSLLASSKIAYPLLTAEGIIELNPEIIIDIIFGVDLTNINPEKIKQDWNCIPAVSAVQKNQIYIINESYTVIPGPRFIQLLEQLAKIIHPEINWEN